MGSQDQQQPLEKPVAGTGRLQSIDVLRGVAALGVLLCHIKSGDGTGRLDARFFAFLPLSFGALGVPLFVVLSGFCIHLTVAKRFAADGRLQANWVAFWGRRFHRLYPPFLAAMLVGLASYYLSRPEVIAPYQIIHHVTYDIITHIFMVHNIFVDYWAGCGNFPLWTLAMEEHLYALYAIYIVLRRRYSVSTVIGVVLLVSLAWAFASRFLFPESVGSPPLAVGEWGKWAFTFWPNWVLGAIAAEAYAGVIALPRWCSDWRIGLAAGIIGLATHQDLLGRAAASAAFTRALHDLPLVQFALQAALQFSMPAFALAFFTLVNAWVAREVRGSFRGRAVNTLAWVGQFSYSLYLTHIPVLTLCESIAGLDSSLPAVAFRFAVFVPISLGVALAFYHLIEKRFLNRRPRSR